MNAAGHKVVPDEAPVDFVPRKWTSVVLEEGAVNKHAWEFALLHEARTALRAGDLTVEGSQRYAAWDRELYQSDAWATRREAWYSEQALQSSGESFVSDYLDQLHRQTQRVAKRMARNKNHDACVEGEKLKLTASALSLVINAIVVWNTRYFERAQEALAQQGVLIPEQVWQHLSPLQWAHIHLNGSYHFTDVTLTGEFRPLREYQGPRLYRSALPSLPERAETDTTPEEEEILTPIQLSLLGEEENDL